jgi:hypothetical protein
MARTFLFSLSFNISLFAIFHANSEKSFLLTLILSLLHSIFKTRQPTPQKIVYEKLMRVIVKRYTQKRRWRRRRRCSLGLGERDEWLKIYFSHVSLFSLLTIARLSINTTEAYSFFMLLSSWLSPLRHARFWMLISHYLPYQKYNLILEY